MFRWKFSACRYALSMSIEASYIENRAESESNSLMMWNCAGIALFSI